MHGLGQLDVQKVQERETENGICNVDGRPSRFEPGCYDTMQLVYAPSAGKTAARGRNAGKQYGAGRGTVCKIEYRIVKAEYRKWIKEEVVLRLRNVFPAKGPFLRTHVDEAWRCRSQMQPVYRRRQEKASPITKYNHIC